MTNVKYVKIQLRPIRSTNTIKETILGVDFQAKRPRLCLLCDEHCTGLRSPDIVPNTSPTSHQEVLHV